MEWLEAKRDGMIILKVKDGAYVSLAEDEMRNR